MSGSIYQAATELSFGERDGRVTITFLRGGDLSTPATAFYDVTSESATPGVDFTGASGSVTFAAGQDRATVSFDIINDALSEATETFVVSLVSIENGQLGVPRTLRVNILDDENPVLPPVDPPLTSPYTVSTQTVITGVNQPINIEFSPVDPNVVYVAEKGGAIRVYNLQTGASLGTFVDLSPVTNDVMDRGLLDIAFHPDFVNNPYVYAFYVVDPPGIAEPDKFGNRFAHVVRFTADSSNGYLSVVPGSGVIIAGGAGTTTGDISGGGTLDFTETIYANQPSSERYIQPNDPTPATVINGIKQNYIKVDSVTHAGGSLAFGPDGMLYISIGDGASPNYADPHALDVQNLDSMSGKILRVDPLTGRGLTDNPFYQSGQSLDSNISKVYQYGLRNPFSMAFDDLGRLFITDTGWNAYEEINSAGPGANFGWPFYEGKEGGQIEQTSSYRDLPQAAAFYQGVANGTIVVTAPYAAFGHATSAPGFQNQAITGGTVVYDGNRYPAEFQGDYFFSNFPFGHVFTVDTNDRTKVNYLYTSQLQFGPVHFTQGPDGYVYFADLGEGNEDTGYTNGFVGRLLITDPRGPQVTVAATPASVTEGAGPATIQFSLNAAQGAPVIITYSTTNGSATAGTDFTGATNATVTIPAGQTSVVVSIPIVNDAISESTETFAVTLNGATLNGGPIAAAGSATVTILDNDGPPPNLLVNGSLEQPTLATGAAAFFQTIPGWTAITGGTIELWNAHDGVTAAQGVNFAELDYAGARDGFFQDVTTAAGQVYTLTFDLRARAGFGAAFTASTCNVEVVWNNTVVATVTPGAAWAPFSVNVTGTGAADRLTIREVQAQSADGLGALIDNFRLVAQIAAPAAEASFLAAPTDAALIADDPFIQMPTDTTESLNSPERLADTSLSFFDTAVAPMDPVALMDLQDAAAHSNAWDQLAGGPPPHPSDYLLGV